MADPYPNSALPVYDVTQSPYNADRTGSADARQKIQDAIDDAASSDGKYAGAIVFIPVGIYKIGSDSIILKSNVRIVGEVAQNNSGVVLKPDHGSTHVPVFKYESGSTYITGWSIENIAIDFTNCTSGGAPSSANSGDIGISISWADEHQFVVADIARPPASK